MLTHSTLQKAFRLIYPLHPHRAVAICILIEACEWMSRIRHLQRRRHGYKLQTPEAGLMQFSVYSVSEKWEKDQESECPAREPIYKPTPNDRLVRYVKALALKSMDWRSLYAAVGVGCLLYQYEPHEVSFLAEDVFQSDNIRRVKSKMSELLKERFAGANGLSNGNGQLQFETPNDRQRTLINTSLSRFAPWGCCCSTPSPSDSLLETYFAKSSEKSEWERLHVLFDSACGGFSRLVDEYNSVLKGNEMRLKDPEEKLGSPKFGGYSQGPTDDNGGEPPDPTECFNPAPLTDDEISIIRHSLERNERRRNKFRASEFRVFVDGEEIATVDPSSPEPFAIPATASYVEVFGKDKEGELLLAVLPLNYNGVIADGFEQQISVTGGQRIDVSIFPRDRGQSRESTEPTTERPENLVLLNYSEMSNQESLGMFGIGKFGRFRILEKIGSSATGVVYKAEDVKLKRLSAIKVFHLSDAHINTDWVKKGFKTEITKLAQCKHAGVGRIYEFDGLSESHPYLVMEHVAGVSLREALTAVGMELERVARLSRQMGQILSAAHAVGVFHCDLKPTNILLQDTGDNECVKIVDFGIAKLFDKCADPPWHSIEAEASSVYMAPEQLLLNKCSIQSDIYAMGAILYEMLTGRSPFPTDSFSQLIESKRQGIKVNLCDLRSDLPQRAQHVVLNALAFDPKDRYCTAQELGDALAEALTDDVETSAVESPHYWLAMPQRSRRSSEPIPLRSKPLADVLQEVVSGDQNVQDLLTHYQFQAALRKVCRSFRVPPHLSAEDLYQDVCLRLLRSGDSLTWNRCGEERALFGWLRVVARNVLIDQAKHRMARATYEERRCNYDHPDTQLRMEFEEFIGSIPEKHQKAVVLWMEGYTFVVIAQKLNAEGVKCSQSTVGSWIKRIIRKFQEWLIEETALKKPKNSS